MHPNQFEDFFKKMAELNKKKSLVFKKEAKEVPTLDEKDNKNLTKFMD